MSTRSATWRWSKILYPTGKCEKYSDAGCQPNRRTKNGRSDRKQTKLLKIPNLKHHLILKLGQINHNSSVIRCLTSVFCHLTSVFCHLTSVFCLLTSVFCLLPSEPSQPHANPLCGNTESKPVVWTSLEAHALTTLCACLRSTGKSTSHHSSPLMERVRTGIN